MDKQNFRSEDEMDHDSQLLEQRIDQLAEDIKGIRQDMRKVLEGQTQLIRLEERHVSAEKAICRAFNDLKDHSKRLAQLELEAPVTRLVRGWVITGVLGVVGALGAQVLIVVFYLAPLAK